LGLEAIFFDSRLEALAQSSSAALISGNSTSVNPKRLKSRTRMG
jgi:hypothetical protein